MLVVAIVPIVVHLLDMAFGHVLGPNTGPKALCSRCMYLMQGPCKVAVALVLLVPAKAVTTAVQ